MRVQIYQINFQRDHNDLKYKPVMDAFAQPDQISQEEVEADMGFTYIFGI